MELEVVVQFEEHLYDLCVINGLTPTYRGSFYCIGIVPGLLDSPADLGALALQLDPENNNNNNK